MATIIAPPAVGMTYGVLKTNLAAWINRTDLTGVIPTFITLAEDRIFRGSASLGIDPLRVGAMLTTINPFSGTVPDDFAEMKRVSWILSGGIKYPLEFLPLEKIGPYEGISGRPQYYSIKGNQVIYGPTFANDVEIIYYARPSALTSDSDTNFILAKASSIYLYGAMIEAAIYLKDGDLADRMSAAFRDAVVAYQSQDDGDQHSGNTLRIRSDARVAV